jgi:hypothetical protein
MPALKVMHFCWIPACKYILVADLVKYLCFVRGATVKLCIVDSLGKSKEESHKRKNKSLFDLESVAK